MLRIPVLRQPGRRLPAGLAEGTWDWRKMSCI